MLKYSLVKNWLTERPDDCSAQVKSLQSIDKEAIVERMLNKGTTVARTDILAVLNSFEETVVEVLIEGNSINLPLFNTLFSMSGVFDNQQDSFDSSRHKLNINLRKGVLLRQAEKQVKFEKTNPITPQPHILEIRDLISDTKNQKITPQGVVEILGYNLKIQGDDPACGLWFCSGKNTEVKAEIIVENRPAKIIAIVPNLNNNLCKIKVVTQSTVGGRVLKNPKSFQYSKTLKVVK
ncbi:MAG: DUF4469 domain-containing protein [Lentimicrobiaceae bacterium]|nr:DUF4469 domain-containing protein [Lentimicrobiaceae bacterium]